MMEQSDHLASWIGFLVHQESVEVSACSYFIDLLQPYERNIYALYDNEMWVCELRILDLWKLQSRRLTVAYSLMVVTILKRSRRLTVGLASRSCWIWLLLLLLQLRSCYVSGNYFVKGHMCVSLLTKMILADWFHQPRIGFIPWRWL